MNTAEYWIQHLQLLPHPEGGFYRETYRSNIAISRSDLPVGFLDDRRLSTCIYYLLRSDEISKLHRLKSDEIWFYHFGSPLRVYEIDSEGAKHTHILGANHEKAEQFSLIIPAGHTFCAEVVEKNTFGLVSCMVSPGFDFNDFEIFEREDLLQAYPKHKELIEKFS